MVIFGTLVGHNIEFILLALDNAVVVIKTLEQYAEVALSGTLVENLTTRCTLRAGDKYPAAVIALPAGIAGARGGKCAYFFCSICGIVRKLGKIISPVFYIVFNVIHKVVFCIVFLAPLCFLADAVSSIYNA